MKPIDSDAQALGRSGIITKKIFEAAPPWSVFRGEAADPGVIFWVLIDGHEVEAPAVVEVLDVDFTQPQLDSEYLSLQPPGADDHDAALAYLRSGGTLCKVPDAPGSPFWRLLVAAGVPENSIGPGEILVIVSAEPSSSASLQVALASGYFEDTGRRVHLVGAVAAVWRIRPPGAVASRPQSTRIRRATARQGTSKPIGSDAQADRVLGLTGARSALSAEDHAALAEVQRRIGRRWKAAVRLAWETGNYSDIATTDENLPSALQRLRNASYFGPSGLVAYGGRAKRAR